MDKFFSQKLNMISCPTPFHEMKNLRKALNAAPRLFIKRDDLTEIGLGGNKSRKLDYVMKEAVENGTDTIITWGGAQSNHARQTLAFAKILDMDCHIVVNGENTDKRQGNLLIYDIFGAELHYEPDEDKCPDMCEKIAVELKQKGKKPYVIPIGASTPLGSLGYIESIKEIGEQAAAAGIHPEHIFLASGSAGTQGGAEIGAKIFMPDCRIHGVSVSRYRDEQSLKVAKLCNEISKFIDKDFHFEKEDICIHDEYFGGVYGVPTQAAVDAIKLVGATEAILLDPVYTGKAMSGLIDMLKKGVFDESEAVVFLHTGGSTAVFNFAEHFAV